MANPGIIRLDYTGAMEKVNKARGYRQSHDDVIKNLQTLINSLNEVWEGNRSTQLVNEFAGYQSTFTQFSQLLDDYANKMQQWADDLKQYDDSASAT